MPITVTVFADTLGNLKAGGHFWVYLNWALGLSELGCEVIWLEEIRSSRMQPGLQTDVAALKGRLEPFGLSNRLALCSSDGHSLNAELMEDCLALDAATASDLLLCLRYDTPSPLVDRFHRSALID